MNVHSNLRFFRVAVAAAALAFGAGRVVGAGAATVAAGTVNLGVTPPDLTTSVDPDIVVTFDDSGSMASDFMGDYIPYNGTTSTSWSSKWYCAGVIGGTSKFASYSMNGVYYNPGTLYLPPVNADGSSFPQADATLKAVVNDGVTAYRPRSPSGSGTTTNFLATGSSAWKCPGDKGGSNPIAGGGPYYYVWNGKDSDLGTGAMPTASTLYVSGSWKAVALTNQSVTINGVTTTTWQNWANWYSYYRTRNLMTRTALSRVFSNFGSNLRVAWQNINDGNFLLPTATIISNIVDTSSCTASTVDPKAVQTTAAGTMPSCYRSALFNWIFQVPANGTTPDRAATIRAGDFFKRGGTTKISDLTNPYWQPADAVTGTAARELSCRQNFHMLVTDGYWNEGDPTLPGTFYDSQTSRSLPDGTAYDASGADSRVYWNVQGTKYTSSLANIAFNYWAQDLRTDLTNNVPAYFPDKTTGVTGSTPLASDADPSKNAEIYFNPANDPATWQHVVQFMVTLGIAGNLTYSDDVDCVDANNDLCKLRKGLVNSTGKIGWPTPVNNSAPAIDDTWHAAINSRGSYFSASNPGELVSHLTQIIANVLVRSSASTAAVTSLPFQTVGTAAYGASYDSSDWSGRLMRTIPYDSQGNPITPPTIKWDAGCTLTGGNCPDGNKSARTPSSRVILTSDGGAGRNHGVAFQWGNLTSTQQGLLNANPAKIAASSDATTWTVGPDNFGSQRVSYLRGDRTYEVPATGGNPQFRHRSSVLGAVINSQPLYNASAASGWFDVFPDGSPEAFVVGTSTDYQHFVNNNKDRAATVYVGSDDGMLHAFNATDGTERWAYVPSALIANGNLTRITDKSRGLTPGVDATPTAQDVFINGAWHTVLVGSFRLGGRGIYALDITKPAAVAELNAKGTVLWEFSNTSSGGANLGYTYGKPNIVRLNNGKWAVLLSSGYFPNGPTTDSYNDPASAETAASQTSLFVIDLETGALIREIKTSTAAQAAGVTTFGLSQPGVYDYGGDQVDDVAVAGDLAGNLWRFDLADADPTKWKVDLMFKTYPSSATYGIAGATTCDVAGKCPITVMPIGMRNPDVRGVVWIFGTGKYLGNDDRSSNIPAQSFYGIYDSGTASPNYPILPAKLNVQAMVENTVSGVLYRFVTQKPATMVANAQGWTLPLNLSTEQGERNVVTGSALDTSNTIILATLIPTTSDPCNPGRKGSLIVLDAASGGGVGITPTVASPKSGYIASGIVDSSGSIPSSGELPVTTAVGGGQLGVLGVGNLGIPDNYWYRTAWRELLDLL